MQSLLREKLMALSNKLSVVSGLYRTDAHRFVGAYFAWLEEAERELAALRTPLSIVLQSERSSLAAILDGYLPEHLQAATRVRKTQRAAAAQSLERVAREFYGKIETIDHSFTQFREQLSQALAAIATVDNGFYGSLTVDQTGVDRAWRTLQMTRETLPMANYLSARLSLIDVNYILIDLIQNIVAKKPTSA
jgi:hypothetical protein